jgi:serine phosphatase RsbU (regulator of sigma subunit)
VELAPGDVLALITDGIFERERADGDDFGVDRVLELIRGGGTTPLAALVARIASACDAFASGAPQADDMTLLLVRRTASR